MKSRPGTLKLALKRGALVTAANWQVVLVQFVADTLFKTLLAVPIVGGVVLVVLLIGGDPKDLLRLELAQVIPTMVGVLLAQPLALTAFLGALVLVLIGGSLLTIAVKAGTVTVLIAGERAAGVIERPPLRMAALTAANQSTLDRFVGGVRYLFARYVWLGAGLSLMYAVLTGGYLAALFAPSSAVSLDSRLAVTVASLVLIVLVTLLNFCYLLSQIVVATEDCTVYEAISLVGRLLRRRPIELTQALGTMLALMALVTAASILAMAALGLIAFVPFVGLAALPLQLLAWLIRGVVFQFVGLTGLVTYVRLYRTAEVEAPALGAHTAHIQEIP
ncbi:MAG: hypothetical protein ACRD2A_01015 [Vicinamibacterales bacterium]